MRKLKAFIAVLTAFCICAAYMPLTENTLTEISRFSAHAETSGTCGENLTFTLDSEGTLTISGTGEMTSNSWYSNKEAIKKVIIKNGVTSITMGAFSGCTNLTSIIIPDSVTSIGEFAFSECSSLVSITIPNSVTFIGGLAFSDCYSLTSVTIPDGVTSIGKSAFYSCTNLSSVTIKNPNCEINDASGTFCNNYTNENYPFSGTIYGYPNSTAQAYAEKYNRTFSALSSESEPAASGTCGENLTWVLDDEGTLTISGTGKMSLYANPHSFNTGEIPWDDQRNYIKNIVIESGVTSIDKYAFYRSYYDGKADVLTSITISDTVTSIGEDAFKNCDGLTFITLPDSITAIGMNAFEGCSGLTSITIPDSVTKIDSDAFKNCSSLVSVTIGSGVTNIGYEVFMKCSNLTSIEISEKNSAYISENGVLYNKDKTTLLLYLTKNTASEYVIPDTITQIAAGAFSYCSNLTSVTIPSNVTEIQEDAFEGCSNLTSVTFENPDCKIFSRDDTIPEVVTLYGYSNSTAKDYAEKYNRNFIALDSEPEEPAVSGTCGENLTWMLDGETLTISGTGDMTDYEGYEKVPWYSSRNTIKKISIADGVTSIGNYAFYDTRISSISIPNSITKIGNGAFYGCDSLLAVTIPNQVKSLAFESFRGCSNLQEVNLPEGITEIDEGAFSDCGFSSITIPESVKRIYDFAFDGCENLESITFGKNIEYLGMTALGFCSKLTSVTFENPDCDISGSDTTICNRAESPGVYIFDGIIYGYSNSTAQTYAEKCSRTFAALDSEPEEPTTEAPTEPATEEPTQPTTEAPTESSTEEPSVPSRENKFVEGGDNWSFSNSRSNFGNTYFIQDSYYKKLVNGLNNIEKEKIYQAVRNTKWNGSCYGMAVTSILASNAVVHPADYQKNANFLHDISAPPSDEVKSLINYYFMLQFTDNIQNQTRQSAYESEETKLKKLISCLEDDSPALLTYFGYFNGSKFSYGGHAVVAYDIEYGTYSKDGKAYNGKILTYDNNNIDYGEDSCLYFNTSDWSWAIPYYQLDSAKGSTLGFISDDKNQLNAHGYLNSEAYQNSVSDDYIAMLDADTISGDYAIHKVTYSNGTWMNAPTAEDDIKLFSSLSDTQESNNLCFALKDAESGYVMEMNTSDSMDLSMNYENTLLNANASKGLNMCFSPEGCISLEGEKTDYQMEIVLNNGFLITDWYYFAVQGANADSAKLEKSKDGYLLTASNLNNINAEAYNDENECFIRFSSDADTVLLYEIDAQTIGVKEDTNGDGIYDKVIAKSSVRQKGDVDGDTLINAKDAAAVLVSAANTGAGKGSGLAKAQFSDADVNQDGNVNAMDAAAILTYAAAVGAGNSDISLSDFIH